MSLPNVTDKQPFFLCTPTFLISKKGYSKCTLWSILFQRNIYCIQYNRFEVVENFYHCNKKFGQQQSNYNGIIIFFILCPQWHFVHYGNQQGPPPKNFFLSLRSPLQSGSPRKYIDIFISEQGHSYTLVQSSIFQAFKIILLYLFTRNFILIYFFAKAIFKFIENIVKLQKYFCNQEIL